MSSIYFDIRHSVNRRVRIIAGLGEEGNDDGTCASFSQPMGICVENGKNIFVTDAHVEAVKLITDAGCAVKFLENLGKLYQAFSVHQKHKRTHTSTLQEAPFNLCRRYWTPTSRPMDPKELLQARQSGLLTWLTSDWQGYKETSRKWNQNWQWTQKPSLLWKWKTYTQFHISNILHACTYTTPGILGAQP